MLDYVELASGRANSLKATLLIILKMVRNFNNNKGAICVFINKVPSDIEIEDIKNLFLLIKNSI